MNRNLYSEILHDLDIKDITSIDTIQSLWSGYGELVRVSVESEVYSSLIIKHVNLPEEISHPKGWNSSISHQRKIQSYNVEFNWYRHYSAQLQQDLPHGALGILCEHESEGEWLIVMEDLALKGFPNTSSKATPFQRSACLRWLAHFHAMFIGDQGEGLWDSGTYWHLDTRPDELEALEDQPLKQAAQAIDQKLKEAPYQTLVHGDAKLANFCFSNDDRQAAAVDFQYVGKGCAMKDVALFISSAVESEECAQLEQSLLDEYFGYLRQALVNHQPNLDASDVENAWRPMFTLAWADFQRFVKGWSPTHWKINEYTESVKGRALKTLGYLE